MLIVTCIHSGVSWAAPVEALDCVFSIVEAFYRVPDFVVFWSVSFPLSSILGFVVVVWRVDDFVKFVFLFSFYLNRRRWFFDLRRETVILVSSEEGDMESLVDGH